jgi:hypothetical protein
MAGFGKALFRLLIVVVVLCAIALVFELLGKLWPSEQASFEAVSREDTVESYNAFLQAHPEGTYAREARYRLDEKCWEEVRQQKTVEVYRKYLRLCPKGGHACEAKKEVRQKDLAPELAPACKGLGAARAAGYRQGPGPHPIVFLTEEGNLHDWDVETPATWQREAVAEIELVAVVGPQRETVLEVVHYNGPSITRCRYDLTVHLHEARTGRRIATKHFHTVPREARYQEPYSLTRLGSPVSRSEVEGWLAHYVLRTEMPGVKE